MTQTSFGYEPRLDGLRAFSVLAVLLFHTWEPIFVGGWLGVDIFFAISGYLITRILVREWRANAKIDLFNFYRNRALRLLPALMALLLAYSLYCVVSRTDTKTWAINFFGSLLYVMNWVRAFNIEDSVVGHTWSLSIEEQFYLVWPFVMIFAIKRPEPKRWVIGLLLVALAWKATLLLLGNSPARIYNGFDTHVDSILIGCLLGLGWKASWLRRPALMAALMIAFVFIVPWDKPMALMFGQGFAALSAVALISRIEKDPAFASILKRQPIVYIGRISYGIYLWHFPVIILGKHHVPDWAVFMLPLLSVAVAATSFHILERPFLRLKRAPKANQVNRMP